MKTGCFLDTYKHITRSCEHYMIFPILSPESALWTKEGATERFVASADKPRKACELSSSIS